MTAKCPHCGKELDYVHQIGTVVSCLNADGDMFDEYYADSDITFECPECNEQLVLGSATYAMKFLRGEESE